jgi:hypothetical protein
MVIRIAVLTRTAAVLVAGVSVALWLVPPAPGKVTGRSLLVSVEDRAGSVSLVDTHACVTMAAARTWECGVSDREGSGGATYRVRVLRDGSCWTARLTHDYSEGGMPARLSGCVRARRRSLIDVI